MLKTIAGAVFLASLSLVALAQSDPKESNGVKTASCRCPYGEGLFGQKAKNDRGYVTYAGSTWSNPTAACKELPVGYPDQLLQ